MDDALASSDEEFHGKLQMQAFVNGTLTFTEEAVAEKIATYADVIKMESSIPGALKKAIEAYRQYE